MQSRDIGRQRETRRLLQASWLSIVIDVVYKWEQQTIMKIEGQMKGVGGNSTSAV